MPERRKMSKEVEKIVRWFNSKLFEFEKAGVSRSGYIEVKANPIRCLFINPTKLKLSIEGGLNDFRFYIDDVSTGWNRIYVFYSYEDSEDIPRFADYYKFHLDVDED